MTLNKITSERLSLLRFPLIVGVVFIHANVEYSGIIIDQQSWFSDFFRTIISRGIARISVPIFFLMSGFFFFLGFSWTLDKYKKKIRSRINTLLLPFLFWNFLILGLLAIAQSLPATQVFFSGKNDPISTFKIYDYFNAIIGIDRYPISYQFWFIRDLIAMVFLVPVIQLILKTTPKLFLGIIFILWFFNLWLIYIPSAVAFTFFYAGAFIANSSFDFFSRIDKYGQPMMLAYFIILLVDTLTKNYSFNSYIHNTGILFGIVSVLYATKILLNNKNSRTFLLWSQNYSFFVFAIHEPLQTIIRKLFFKIMPPISDFMLLVYYFIIPTFVIALSITIHIVLKSITPKFVSIITGSR